MNTQVTEQLRAWLQAGQIDQATYDQLLGDLRAQVQGSGALAQGDRATAVATAGVAIRGDSHAPINTGVQLHLHQTPDDGPAAAQSDSLRQAYLRRVWSACDRLQLVGGDVQHPMRLGAVYTALLTTLNTGDLHSPNKAQRDLPHTLGREQRPRALSAVAALNHHRHLVLLGGPGSGKSSFVNYVALCMAGSLLGSVAPHPEPNLHTLVQPLPPADERDDQWLFEEPPKPGQPQPWNHGALVPVRVVLRDLAAQMPVGTPGDAGTVWRYLQADLESAALGEYAALLKDELLQHGGLVLFDGMDEVPEAEQRRQAIQQAVLGFTESFSKCRVLVTCRTYAYQKQDWKLPGFTAAPLRLFAWPQIKAFVTAWYLHMAATWPLAPEEAQARTEELLRRLQANPRVAELARYPLLLTLLARVHEARSGDLPTKREALYSEAVKLLLDDWERSKRQAQPQAAAQLGQPSLSDLLKADSGQLLQQLYRLAFDAHLQQKDLQGTADIRPADVVEALMRASGQRSDVNPLQLRNYLQDRAGILVETGVGWLQFPHRTFQEYLAACHLANDGFPHQLAQLLCAQPERWREATLLAAAHAARGNRALPTWALVDALCPTPLPEGCTSGAAWGALLAGQVLVELEVAHNPAPEHQHKLNRVREAQLVLMRGTLLPATERALAGRTLAALGDPRPEVMTLAGMQFAHIPAGPFRMGSEEERDSKSRIHTLDLPADFCMARYPVTVAQWREYLNASRAQPPDPRSTQGDGNLPAAYISWHEARSFCAWLRQHWQGLLPEGWTVDLPSEAEWEKAARGGLQLATGAAVLAPPQTIQRVVSNRPPVGPNPWPARAYPWGDAFDNDRTNTVEAGIHQRCVVGAFAGGASPYGCEDMAGQVWEWTRSAFMAYPYRLKDKSREPANPKRNTEMIVRGGSWDDARVFARCACRLRLSPDNREYYLGFRVVLRSSPVS